METVNENLDYCQCVLMLSMVGSSCYAVNAIYKSTTRTQITSQVLVFPPTYFKSTVTFFVHLKKIKMFQCLK